jgi:hypothetical protein
LRNKLVHKVENISFSFKTHMGQLTQQEKKLFIDAITWFAKDNDSRLKWRQIAEQQPTVVVLMGVIQLVGICTINAHYARGLRRTDELSKVTTTKAIKKSERIARKAIRIAKEVLEINAQQGSEGTSSRGRAEAPHR